MPIKNKVGQIADWLKAKIVEYMFQSIKLKTNDEPLASDSTESSYTLWIFSLSYLVWSRPFQPS